MTPAPARSGLDTAVTGRTPIADGLGRALLLFAGLAVVLFLPAVLGQRVFSFRDLADYAIPLKLFTLGEWLDGRVPLWNPYSFFGFPHLAGLQSGVFYPPNLLLLLGFPYGYDLSLIVHYPIAAVGAWALARQMDQSRGGACVAGVAFGFSTYLVSLTDLNAFLATSAWLPWLVVTAIALGRRPSGRRSVVVAVVYGLGFLAGEPQTLVVGAVLAGLLSLALVPGRQRLQLVLWWGAAGAISLCLVAPSLLPFVELVARSERSGGGLSEAEVYRYSVEPEALVTLALPGVAGDVVQGTHWLGEQTYVRSPYLGVAALLLAGLGCGRGRDRLALMVVAVGAVALALGPDSWLYPALYELGFSQSRFPVKFLVFAVLALALLAGTGFDAVASGGGSWGRSIWAGLWLVLALAAITVPRASVRTAGVHAAVVVVGLSLAGHRARRGPVGRAMVVVVVAADLLVAAGPVLTTTPASTYLAAPPVARRLGAPASGRTCGWPRVYNPQITGESLAWVYQEGPDSPESLQRKKELLFGNTHLLYDLAIVRGGESVVVNWASDIVELLDRGPASRPILDLVGAGSLVSLSDLSGFGYPSQQTETGAFVHDNPGVGPRAFLVGRSVHVADRAERLELLAKSTMDWRQVAILEDPDVALSGVCRAPVDLVDCDNQRLEFAVDSDGRCLLVVVDTWYPGWEARIDGQLAPVLRVDHGFRGVVVDPGRHRVELRYAPRSFGLGLRLAGLGLLAGTLVAVGSWSSARRRLP